MWKLVNQYHVQILLDKRIDKKFNKLSQYPSRHLFIIAQFPIPKKLNRKRNYSRVKTPNIRILNRSYLLDLNLVNPYRNLNKKLFLLNQNQSYSKKDDIYLYLINFPLLTTYSNSHKI